MSFSVTEFAAAGLPQGGARPSLFSVIVDTPNGIPNIGARISFTCSAANLPASTLGLIEVPYFGRRIKLAGNRTFENWSVTIMNDEDFQVRNALEQWSNAINRHQANLRATNLATPAQYRTTGTVTQYSKTGVPIRTYEFVNLFPATISTIDLNWETADAIETYTVDWAYDYWRVVAPGTTGVLNV